MAQREIELLRDLYARWARGDFRGGRELLDPDVEFNLGTPDYETTPARGSDQIEQQMREFLANWTAYRVEAEEFVDAGDSVLVRARQRGVGKHSGVEVDAPLFGVWTFREGKVLRIGVLLQRAGSAQRRRPVPLRLVEARHVGLLPARR